jgi:hypothetical protein
MHSRLSIFARIRDFLSNIFGPSVVALLDLSVSRKAGPGETGEPYVGVREPKRRSPSGRSSAIALKEPDE